MDLTAKREKHIRNKDLYDALKRGDKEKVIQLCRQNSEGPLHILTIHKDTVLHMAIYSKQICLVLDLLLKLPNDDGQFDKLTHQNDRGNTILHEAATSNRIVPAVREMLLKAPNLLSMRNVLGETALYRAAYFGQQDMFEFLDDELNKIVENEADLRAFHQRDDKTTTLHTSILTEHFDLALSIARKYEYLIGERDENDMTALQLLACNPSAFKIWGAQGSLKRFIYSRISTEVTTAGKQKTEDTTLTEKVETCCRVPLWESIRMRKQRYESAVRLAKFLIERDTSWEDTESASNQTQLKTHRYGGEGQRAPTSQETGLVRIAETPLFLATKYGIIEIVEEVLTMYPQAIEHVDHKGRNILHVAIMYRQMHIFDFVVKMEIPMIRLIPKIDNNGNSILHFVGKKKVLGDEDMRSPALQLQENLLVFERVKNISRTYFVKHFNSKGKTAEMRFRKNTAALRSEAKDWLKRTAENSSIVAVLIATVSFAAAYTIPGGPNQSTGYPLLVNQPFFIIFAITDVLSLTFALTSVIVLLSILTSSFRLKDFKRSLPQKLMLGLTLLIFSVLMMMLAFAATILLMLRNNANWTRIALYSVALLPVSFFAVINLPLYISLMQSFTYFLKKIGRTFPQCSSDPHRYSTTSLALVNKLKATIPSNPSQSQPSSSTCHYINIE